MPAPMITTSAIHWLQVRFLWSRSSNDDTRTVPGGECDGKLSRRSAEAGEAQPGAGERRRAIAGDVADPLQVKRAERAGHADPVADFRTARHQLVQRGVAEEFQVLAPQ